MIKLDPKLDLPLHRDSDEILTLLLTVSTYARRPQDPWVAEYARLDVNRFIYTESLLPEYPGITLELGAAPYLFTALANTYRRSTQWAVMNYGQDLVEGNTYEAPLHWYHGQERHDLLLQNFIFNIEGKEKIPWLDHTFDTIVFCEVLEHLTHDPALVLHRINRLLKPGGLLILSTPNALSLERYAFQLRRINIQNDKYSMIGPYGRHNREYSLPEVENLLHLHGFAAELSVTGNTRQDFTESFGLPSYLLAGLVQDYRESLGYFIFGRWRKIENSKAPQRPFWLYNGYPARSTVMNEFYHLGERR